MTRRQSERRLAPIARALAVCLLCASCDAPAFEPAEQRIAPAPIDPTDPIAPIPRDPPALDPGRVALGRALFVDPILSDDGAVTCAVCHHEARAGTDGLARSRAPRRPEGPINVPTIFNLAWASRFTWSGRFDSVQGPLHVAMTSPSALASSWETASARLARSERYVALFEAAYGAGPSEATLRDALASYILSLTTPDAPFDRWLRGDEDAIGAEAVEGYRIFRDYGCATCHQGVGIGGNMYQRFGVMRDYFADREHLTDADQGLFIGTRREEDRHVFRVPSLRNVALTPPYFHDGSAATLEDAVRTMARYQLGRSLRQDQVESIVAFLRSLTGRIDSSEPAGARAPMDG